ncbi:hypothetical protein LOK49_LG10G00792 [Camellia lanceoleosa]|uniref:Uncharacterized protein n=1 Tax=Camellia lanceoleosa TaxID=1840588 RepID=A0ACC0G771_9ERIC|nr:hypothetical protein LOK49_LG10G00792 [Camellia lanceoleosa]
MIFCRSSPSLPCPAVFRSFNLLLRWFRRSSLECCRSTPEFRRSFTGAPPAKTAGINGDNGWALAAVLLPPLKVGINGGSLPPLKVDFITVVKDTFSDGFFNGGINSGFRYRR